MSSDSANRTALTARAVAAFVSVVSAYGAKVDAPYVLNNTYLVRVYLQSAPIFARISTVTALLRAPIKSWLAREISDEGRSAYANAPDSTLLGAYIKMRQVHAIVWVYALLAEFLDWCEHAKVMLKNLRDAQALFQRIEPIPPTLPQVLR